MISGKGGNMTSVKYKNRELILKILKNYGAISRVDIARTLGLTSASITILVNEMVKEGIIKEVGQLEELEKRTGRKKTLIDINYDYKYVIGINIESDLINMGVSNIKGDSIACKSFSTDKSLNPVQTLKNIAKECIELLWKENILKESILGVGVGIVGKVDQAAGTSKHAYGLWKEEVDIKGILEKALATQVVVDNNVRAFAFGEIDHHTANEDAANILLIKYGPGIGMAVIINNKIYYGCNNEAGEIGHTIVEYGGERCRCGRRGCLETVAAEDTILKNIGALFNKENTSRLYELCQGEIKNININTIYEAAKSGDEVVINHINKAMTYLGLAITNAICLYDSRRVILYGKAFGFDIIFNKLKKVIGETIGIENVDDFITLSELNHKRSYIGGVALASREFFYNKGGI
ncbi:MAG: hypothetical protein A2Y21_10510 [Clostridiales bacterium GWC2_40_7]|nr:MAG: hypothetical protein A2Y21_10510 [Clostridiales bacterium GWC2_40_7]